MSTEIKGSRCVEQTGTYPSESSLAGTACSVSNLSDAEQNSYSSEQKSFSAEQKEVADKTYQLIMCNLERHLTIVEMARNLHVSPTQVKVCFRKVYGVPVFTFARKRRMEMAAKLLAEKVRKGFSGCHGYFTGQIQADNAYAKRRVGSGLSRSGRAIHLLRLWADLSNWSQKSQN